MRSGLRRGHAGLRLERGERLPRRRHLLGEARDHAARRVVLVQRVGQLLTRSEKKQVIEGSKVKCSIDV